MKSILTSMLGLGLAFTASAQMEEDREAIKSQCGCHEINFDFVETFIHATDYERAEPYHAFAEAEWIFVDEESEDEIVIQHILIVNGKVIVKHWREDWSYENRDLHTYAGNNEWEYQQLPMESVQGEWTQKVYQVTDAPRYQASAAWVHLDDVSYWESTTNAPLPRREYTKRHDYDIIVRTNRHEILDSGYNHVQTNVKTILEDDGNTTPLVSEAGLNQYRKVEESRCQIAIDWWENNKTYWRIVREEWETVLPSGSDIKIELLYEDKTLYQSLNELATELEGEDEEDIREEVNELLNEYVSATPTSTAVGNL